MSKNTLFQMFGTNKQEETDGVWINYGETRVLVAHAGGANTDFQKMLMKESKPYLKLIRNGSISTELMQQIEHNVYISTIIKDMECKLQDDWQQGVPSPEGDILPLNKENLVGLFKALPHMFSDIKEFASDIGNYKPDLEEAKGN